MWVQVCAFESDCIRPYARACACPDTYHTGCVDVRAMFSSTCTTWGAHTATIPAGTSHAAGTTLGHGMFMSCLMAVYSTKCQEHTCTIFPFRLYSTRTVYQTVWEFAINAGNSESQKFLGIPNKTPKNRESFCEFAKIDSRPNSSFLISQCLDQLRTGSSSTS